MSLTLVAQHDFGQPQHENAEQGPSGFQVHLKNFDGPFDVLLQLITSKKLELTALSLSQVTDDFLVYISQLGHDSDVGQISEFLVVAATLLDAKTAQLLPQPSVDNEEELAALEARDLLVARLLQYRAVKTVSVELTSWWQQASLSYPRPGGAGLEFSQVLPARVAGLSPQALVRVARRVLTPQPTPEVSLTHLHVPVVNVADQAHLISQRLRADGQLTFEQLVDDATHRVLVVARFLAVLELFRQQLVQFFQPQPLGPLTITWHGETDEAFAVKARSA